MQLLHPNPLYQRKHTKFFDRLENSKKILFSIRGKNEHNMLLEIILFQTCIFNYFFLKLFQNSFVQARKQQEEDFFPSKNLKSHFLMSLKFKKLSLYFLSKSVPQCSKIFLGLSLGLSSYYYYQEYDQVNILYQAINNAVLYNNQPIANTIGSLKKSLFIQFTRQLPPLILICYLGTFKMAKKLKKIQPPPDIRTFPISKSKTFNATLNAFIKMLEDHHKHLTSKQFICQVHQFIARYREKMKGREMALGLAKQKIKICRECEGWCGNKNMLQCTLCEDYYHQQCQSKSEQTLRQYGLCVNCETNRIGKFDKQTYLQELLQDRCEKCQLQRQNKQAFVQCLRCSKRFHKKCYGKNTAVCANCKIQIDQQLKSKEHIRQSTLLEYGCSSRKKGLQIQSKSKQINSRQQDQKQKYEQETRSQPIRDMFFNIIDLTEDQIKTYKEGLMFAILAKKMQYTERLIPIQCDLDINTEESLDFGLDHMSRTEYEAYRKYKKQPVGPFVFQYKEGMGYDVVADKDIKERTIICQYIGEVVTLRKCIELEAENKNDSLMELRVGFNSDETLIIRPDKFTNMARFINGINNQKGSNKANVATVRKLAKGIPTVILHTIKNIRKGESLLYDYNAGNTNCLYDTSNFL